MGNDFGVTIFIIYRIVIVKSSLVLYFWKEEVEYDKIVSSLDRFSIIWKGVHVIVLDILYVIL